MERLIEGVHRFHNDEFGNYRSLFRKLSQEGQNPHTLFITCSDSRVLAELITQEQAGRFVCRKKRRQHHPAVHLDRQHQLHRRRD
ncbi:MAG: hypothetical protein WDM80_17850 [Limisphaerales bacterium]